MVPLAPKRFGVAELKAQKRLPTSASSRCTDGKLRATPAELAVHRDFLESVAQLKVKLVRACYFLKLVRDRKIHRALGYETIVDYARDEAGLSRGQCETFLELAGRLPHLPRIRELIEKGDLSWGAARLLSRVVTPETETDWIDAARRLTARQLADVVKQSAADDGAPATRPTPNDSASESPAPRPAPGSPSGQRARSPIVIGPAPGSECRLLAPTEPVHLPLRFTPAQYAIFTAWLAARQKTAKPGTSKEQLLVDALANDAGFGFRLVLIERTDGSVTIATPRGDVAAPPALVDRARCDGEIRRPDGTRRQVVPPRLKRRVFARDGHRCRAKGCDHTQHLEVHHLVPVARGGRSEIGNLISLCARCHRALHERETARREARRDVPA